ncbi:hypothetical protein AB0D24_04975 [Streptomyces javensis]|uniref:hypothetical protein n=1 Tax=Streptomyces javensis TaxID=114698 RepID=UPI0033C62A93
MTDARLVAGVLAVAVLLTVACVAYRRATRPQESSHNPAACRRCVAMRHPSQRAARAALARIPRQRGAR